MKRFALLLFFYITLFPIKGEEYLQKSNITYYPDSACRQDEYIKSRCVLDVYYPTKIKKFATIIWFHGGGLSAGQKEIPERLKNQGFCVIGVNYRLTPKVKAEKCIEDAAEAIAWTFKNIESMGGDAAKIFVSGHSAGGYLTLMTGLDKRWLKVYGIDANKIAGLIPLSGQAITHFAIRAERGIKGEQPIVDEFAPLFYVRADASPLILITGDRELELLGRYEENAYLMRMMKIAGHRSTKLYELQGYGHNMMEPGLPILLKEVQLILKNK
ncbi:MAG: alpha/beta hydrolase [Bacteroidales bacterium]|nr:alpha/beta hydrolase [Bacteroidales bacterium]